MALTAPHRRSPASLVRHGALIGALCSIAACASTRSATPPAPPVNPALDARVGLKSGLMDAEQAVSNMKVLASVASPPGFLGITNSDLAFMGKYAIQGNYNGPVIWDMSNPSKPTLVTAYTCPASQNDISVYKNLMFMSAEAANGRLDCKPGGVPDPVSKERFRGVRVFDITDIKNPKLIANVQTCRGSHTHTVLEDPKDKQNVYIYVSGSSGIRSPDELPGCDANLPPEQQAASKMRIEIIKVPLNDPSKAAVVNRANIFSGLTANPSHSLSEADIEAARKAASTDAAKTALATAKSRGQFIATNPQSGVELAINPATSKVWLDSIVKLRKGTGAPTAADSATLRAQAQTWLNNQLAAAGNPKGAVSDRTQCHDITVYPALGLAGGACEGHGLLLDISNPVSPVRLDAVADSNFSYWHSATFNNDGSKLLFSDEWGGGGGPKCRAGDKPEWGADAIFTIENRKLKFQSYYKIPTYQTSNENCVAHNGSLIPIPDRDVMIQAWYQGGISVFDWSDAKHPQEIASFDRGPIDSTKMVSGGSWSAYWYNGQIISSEIARGLDVVDLVPSQYLTRNEIDAAKTVKWDYLNAQGQPKISWPPSFALAKAYTDQLDRKGCVGVKKIGEIRASISEAESSTGAARATALAKLTKQVDAQKGCDSKKIELMKNTIQGLQTVVM